MQWTKVGRDQWICHVPPDARFTLKALGLADGRWSWRVTAAGSENPMATGIVNTAGDAKHAMEHFMKRAGYV